MTTKAGSRWARFEMLSDAFMRGTSTALSFMAVLLTLSKNYDHASALFLWAIFLRISHPPTKE